MKPTIRASLLFLLVLILHLALCLFPPQLAAATKSPCVIPSTLKFRYALLGNPCSYLDWTEKRLRSLKASGFNAIQLNIAWLRRPNDEALNLNDVVTLPGDIESTRTAQRRAQLQTRLALARKVGLRTLFHFGSPFMWRNPKTGEIHRQDPEAFKQDWYDSANPKVIEYETGLLREFRKAFPKVDDILVYTYDQDAWEASEWGNSKFSRGLPLDRRLPPYLEALHQAWTDGRTSGTDHIMWWEPWELSAGEVYHIVPQLPTQNFGLMLHGDIAEAQITMPGDVWLKNTARMAQARNIPVIVEGFFGSATEEIEPLSFPFPRLTDEELQAFARVKGVVGVKEYFGILTDTPDLNLEMFTARLNEKNPCVSTEQLLQKITARFGQNQKAVISIVNDLADAIQTYPWDASWYARLAGTGNIDHGWNAAFIRGQQVETPSWESTRRAHFMVTEDQQNHPFLLEDVQLRMETAIGYLDSALKNGSKLIPKLRDSPDKQMLNHALADAAKFRRVAVSYSLHLRETNVAMLLRADMDNKATTNSALLKEMDSLLVRDSANEQGTSNTAAIKLKEFRKDAAAWLKTNLLPTTKAPRERGVFTLTTR